METLFDFIKINKGVVIHKDVCELTEEEIIGHHKSDTSDNSEKLTKYQINMFRREFDILSICSKSESYDENKKNILATVFFEKIRVVVTKTEDKVSLKYFTYNLTKNVGVKFFIKQTTCQFITYNLKTNSKYTGVLTNYHKKKYGKQFSKNNWNHKSLTNLSKTISSKLKNFKSENFDVLRKSQIEINRAFEIFLSCIPGLDNSIKDPDERLYKKYLDGHNIKTPNNWMCFDRSQIKLKDFRKHKNKFVDTYMTSNELSGDKVKRVLHRVNSTSGVFMYRCALRLFGNDFMLSQKDEIIINIIESNYNANSQGWNIHLHLKNFTKKEIKNCFDVFKMVLIGEINFSTFMDHVMTKNKLHTLEPVTWQSNTYEKFMEEHFEWSEKLSSYLTATYNRFYNEEFKKIIQEPILGYYPIILVDNKEYNIESFIQSNCVRSYVNRPESIIFSVRKYGIDNKERASVEYRITGDNDDINLIRFQSLGRFNKVLDGSWDEILKVLDNRVEYCLINGIFKLPTFEVIFGKKILYSELEFRDSFEYAMRPGQRGIKTINKALIFSNREIYDINGVKLLTLGPNEDPF
jgi:hypothetical protein